MAYRGLCGQLRVGLLEPLADGSERWVALVIDGAVVGDLVDEEQRQHLDPERRERALLVEMLANGLDDLGPTHVLVERRRRLARS